MWCSRCGAVVWFSLGRWCSSMKNNIILSSELIFFLILYFFLIGLHLIIDMHLKFIEKLESFHWKNETVEFWCHRYKEVTRDDADCEVVQLPNFTIPASILHRLREQMLLHCNRGLQMCFPPCLVVPIS